MFEICFPSDRWYAHLTNLLCKDSEPRKINNPFKRFSPLFGVVHINYPLARTCQIPLLSTDPVLSQAKVSEKKVFFNHAHSAEKLADRKKWHSKIQTTDPALAGKR